MKLDEHRDTTYQSMQPVQRFLYSSPFSGKFLSQIAKKHNIGVENYRQFVITVGDIILGFYKIEDTVPLLQQELGLGAKTAALLGADVLDFLAPLSDPNWQPPVEEPSDDEVTDPAESTMVNTTIASTPTIPVDVETPSETPLSKSPIPNFVIPAKLAARVVPTPQSSPSLPEIHTMASDASLARSPERSSFTPKTDDAEPVHLSSQPEMRQSLSNLPAYTSSAPTNIPTASPIEPEAPRWGS